MIQMIGGDTGWYIMVCSVKKQYGTICTDMTVMIRKNKNEMRGEKLYNTKENDPNEMRWSNTEEHKRKWDKEK